MTETTNGQPVLISTGDYALYETPTGGWHITFIPKDSEKPEHFEIPPFAVQMFKQMQRGEGLPSPMEMVRQMMSNKRD